VLPAGLPGLDAGSGRKAVLASGDVPCLPCPPVVRVRARRVRARRCGQSEKAVARL